LVSSIPMKFHDAEMSELFCQANFYFFH